MLKRENNVTVVWLTGWPCGWKSTAIAKIKRTLEDRWIDVLTLPEAATHFFSSIGMKIWEDEVSPLEFQQELIPFQKNHEDMIRSLGEKYSNDVLVILDRTILDSHAYMDVESFDAILQANNLSHDQLLSGHRYDALINMVTAADGAEKHYTLENNQARVETPEQARDLESRIQAAYNGAKNYDIIDNSTDFTEKIEKVEKAILQVLGLDLVQSQKKFLVKIDDIETVVKGARKIEIEQMYLENRDGFEERIRKRTLWNHTNYYHTFKVSDAAQERDTRELIISEDRYKLLWERAISKITKTRYSIVHNNMQIQIDDFEDMRILWQWEYVCEVKVLSWDADIELPSNVTLINEVTDNPEYLNYNLSRKN